MAKMKLTDEQREVFRMMGRAGGAATAEQMTPEERKHRAKVAAYKRWHTKRKKKPSRKGK